MRTHWFLLLVCLVWTGPPMLALARRVWTTDQGTQGPLILCTGLWALAREARGQSAYAVPGHAALVALAFAAAIPVYVLAGVVGAVSLQLAATYLGLVALLYGLAGARVAWRLWFPLLYLAFLIPLPAPIILWLTASLKLWIAATSVDLLGAAGYEVARSGNALFVDNYELLVEAACSGLNSIVSLLAVGLFYAYARQRTWREAALLGLLIVPIAIFANLVRVMLLLLLVHHEGAGVLATSLHEGAGLLMFFVALAGLYAADTLLAPIARRMRRA